MGETSDGYDVLVSQEVRDLLADLGEKSARIVRDDLEKLTNPHPGRGSGEKERVTWRGREVYRLHIGRTWTAFYDVEEVNDVVKVLRVMPIDDSHEAYGRLD